MAASHISERGWLMRENIFARNAAIEEAACLVESRGNADGVYGAVDPDITARAIRELKAEVPA